MNENWCALCVAIIKFCTPEQAFELLTRNKTIKQKQNRSITKNDITTMIDLKKTMTYKQICELFGLNDNAVYRRIKRYKEQLI